ncbi:MAG: dihydrofolate reductase [Planctomycetota bacterium]
MSQFPSTITAIVASTPEGIIGDNMGMPWRLSSDLRRFKQTTLGGTLLMGRRTFDSIGRVLPGRQTIVLTRNAEWSFEGAVRADSWDAAIDACDHDRLFVVGGGQIYEHFWDFCSVILWTRVWATRSGDTRIRLPTSQFRVVSHQHIPAGPRDEFPTDFQRLERH